MPADTGRVQQKKQGLVYGYDVLQGLQILVRYGKGLSYVIIDKNNGSRSAASAAAPRNNLDSSSTVSLYGTNTVRVWSSLTNPWSDTSLTYGLLYRYSYG